MEPADAHIDDGVSASVLDRLAAIAGPQHVVTDDRRRSYEVDWTGRFAGRCLAVVRPGSTSEVAAIVELCRQSATALVTQGGNTGLVGGGTPDGSGRSIVLSTARLCGTPEVDLAAGQVTASAGTSLARLQEALEGTGWQFGVDLASRGTATIGGMVATNAGGANVVRHGTMRAQVLGLEAVLGTGAIVRRLDGLVKDNTGYDLSSLLCGSEGTLGVVTAARLRLVPAPTDRVVAVVSLPTVTAALELCSRLRRDVEGVDALEAVLGEGTTLVADTFGLPRLFARCTVLVLAEWAGRGEPPAAFTERLGALDALVATDASARARLWAHRERMTEAIARLGVPHKLDVTLPLRSLAAFVDELATTVTSTDPGAVAHVFGHLGDGNLHVNVVGPTADDDRVDDAVLHLVARHRGSISAEHGVGRAKSGYLGLSRSADEISTFRSLKAALDPDGILNPGVLLA